ncbi:MAG: hypothetical protein KIT84_41425 [Labilithrix sp.]|nr:hypothetical protein [Labilithrix sp.]MCW5817533.1 hypothetical protein [Labilithrix sp.]
MAVVEARRWASRVAFAAYFVAGAASADAVAEARVDYEAGAAAYDKKDWGTAAVRFSRADERVPNPRALQLAMASALHLTDAALAMSLVERAEARAVDGSLAELARRLRQRFAKDAARLRVLCKSECKPSLDGHEIAAPSTHWLAPGAHRVEAAGFEKELKLTGGADVEVVVPPPPPPPPPARAPVVAPPEPAAEERHGLRPWVFWTSAGVTGAAAATSTVLTIVSGQRHDDFVANRSPETAAAGEAAQTRSTVAWVATGGLLVATVIIAILTDFGGGKR